MGGFVGFDPELNCLQNNTFFAGALEIIGIDELWTWGALAIVVFATNLINTTKFLIRRSQRKTPPTQVEEETEKKPSRFPDGDCEDLTSENGEDQSSWSETQGGGGLPMAIRKPGLVEGSVVNFWVEINFKTRRSFDLQPQYVNIRLYSKNLSWILCGNLNEGIVLLDMSKEAVIRSFAAHSSKIPAICMISPMVVVAGRVGDENGKVRFNVSDARMGRQIPAALGEWGNQTQSHSHSHSPQLRHILEINSGQVEKLFVTGENRRMAVRDSRMAGNAVSPESDGKTWWDADAVLVRSAESSESEDEEGFWLV